MRELDLDTNPYSIDNKWIKENRPYNQMKQVIESPRDSVLSLDFLEDLFNLDFSDLVYEGGHDMSVREFINKLDNFKQKIIDKVEDIDSDDHYISIDGGNIFATGYDGQTEIDYCASMSIVSRKPRLETEAEVLSRLILEERQDLIKRQKEAKEKETYLKLKEKYEDSSNGTSAEQTE